MSLFFLTTQTSQTDVTLSCHFGTGNEYVIPAANVVTDISQERYSILDTIIVDASSLLPTLPMYKIFPSYTNYVLYYGYNSGTTTAQSLVYQNTYNGIASIKIDCPNATSSIEYIGEKIDFSHNNITSFDFSLISPSSSVTQFELTFEDNSIVNYKLPTTVNPTVTDYTVNLSYNNIKSFIMKDTETETITTLKLNNTNLSNFAMESSSINTQKIKVLYLNSCLLSGTVVIPPQLSSLEEIYIYENKISDLSMPQDNNVLKIIDCSNNLLTALPSLISTTAKTTITTLNISNNPLAAQLDINDFSAIVSLSCSNCNQTAMPTLASSPQTTLTTLDISKNSFIPDFTNFSHLTNLNISSMELTALPTTLNTLTALVSLNISGNNLTSITIPSELVALAEVNVSNCGLTELPAGLIAGTTSLDISRNDLTGKTLDLSTYSSMTSLYASNIYKSANNLNVLTIPTSLLLLDISYDYLASLPNLSSIINLTAAGIVINGNIITNISDLNLNAQISNLKIDNNLGLTELDLSSYSNLQHLICKYCNLQTLSIPNNMISLDCKGNKISSITVNGVSYNESLVLYQTLKETSLKPYACFVNLNRLDSIACEGQTGMGIKNFYPQISEDETGNLSLKSINNYNNTKIIESNFSGYQFYKNWCLQLKQLTTIQDNYADILNYSTTILNVNADIVVDFNGNSSYGPSDETTRNNSIKQQIDNFTSQIDIPHFDLVIYWFNIYNLLTNNGTAVDPNDVKNTYLGYALDYYAQKELKVSLYTNEEKTKQLLDSIFATDPDTQYIYTYLISPIGVGNIYYIISNTVAPTEDIILPSNLKLPTNASANPYMIQLSNIINATTLPTFTHIAGIPDTYIISMDEDQTQAANMKAAIEALYTSNSDNLDEIIINIICYSAPTNASVVPQYHTAYAYGNKLNGSFVYDIPLGKTLQSKDNVVSNTILLSSLCLSSLDLSQCSLLDGLNISYNNLTEFSMYENKTMTKKTYTTAIDFYNDVVAGNIANIPANGFYNSNNVEMIDIKMNFLPITGLEELPSSSDNYLCLIYPQKSLDQSNNIVINGFTKNIKNNYTVFGTFDNVYPTTEIHENFVFDVESVDPNCTLYSAIYTGTDSRRILFDRIYDFNHLENYGGSVSSDVYTTYDGVGNFYSVFKNIDEIMSTNTSSLYTFLSNFGSSGNERMTIYTTSSAAAIINDLGNQKINAIAVTFANDKPDENISNLFNIKFIY